MINEEELNAMGSDNFTVHYSNLVGLNGIFVRYANSEETYLMKNSHGDVIYAQWELEITNQYNYDAFGNEISDSGSGYNPFRYCGEYFDNFSNTYYLRNRYYNPRVGRFTTIDPIKDGHNWYAYCGNNPIMCIDSLGLKEVWIRDWFESRSGMVTPNKMWFGLFGLKSITVSLPGQKAKTYYEDENGYHIKNNYAYIDDSILNRDFRTDGVYGALIAAYGQRGTTGNLSRTWMKEIYPNSFNADKDYWCITFVSWALEQAELPSPRTYSVARAIDWYTNKGAYRLTSDGATPNIGDTMFIGSSHSGLVVAYDPPWVYTIEGCSMDDKVNVVKRYESTITGYGSNGGTGYGVVPDEYDYVRKG